MKNPIDDEQDRENPWNMLEERRSEREEKSMTHTWQEEKGRKTYVHAYNHMDSDGNTYDRIWRRCKS